MEWLAHLEPSERPQPCRALPNLKLRDRERLMLGAQAQGGPHTYPAYLGKKWRNLLTPSYHISTYDHCSPACPAYNDPYQIG